MQAVWRVV